MTAQIAAYGRLVVSLPCHSAESGEAPLWLGVIVFGKQAEALARHSKAENRKCHTQNSSLRWGLPATERL